MGNMKFAIWGFAALALIVYWAWPEQQEDALAYDSAEACIKAGKNEPDVCRAEYEKAKALQEKTAPKYQSANQCQSDFGYNRCYRSGSFWLPFMAGYLLAPRGRSSIFSQPLYRTAGAPNSYRTASGGRIGAISAGGGTKISKSQARRPAVRTRTVSRGGFGARAAGRSSGG